MQNNIKTPFDTKGKDTHFICQLKRTELYFRDFTATRYMAAVDTGISIQNICRYVDVLRDSNKIAVVKIDYCQISGFKAEFLTTNPELFPADNQLKLWGSEKA